jgi:predicted nucleic acid-binding protein
MTENPEHRIFIDSNVLISGIYSSKGAPAKILYLHAYGRLKIVVSQLILIETVLTLREKKPDAIPALNAFLTSCPPEIVMNPPVEQVNKWSAYLSFADAAIFAAAIAAESEYFVTGDSHFFSSALLAEKSGVSIVTPAQLVKLIDS